MRHSLSFLSTLGVGAAIVTALGIGYASDNPHPWITIDLRQRCEPDNKGLACKPTYSCLPMLRRIPPPTENWIADGGKEHYRCGKLNPSQPRPANGRPEGCHRTIDPLHPEGECSGGYLCLDGNPSLEKDGKGQPLYVCGTFRLSVMEVSRNADEE